MHDATIEVSNRPSGGVEFSLFLPQNRI